MKRYLLMMALLVAVSVTCLLPISVFAAENPAAISAIETIHLNQATAEELQALPGSGRRCLNELCFIGLSTDRSEV